MSKQLQVLLTVNYAIFISAGALLLSGCSVAQDRHDAQDAAARIHSKFSHGDFSSIYREATPHFKQLDEKNFVSLMEQMRLQYGVEHKATLLAYQTGPDSDIGRSYVIISDLEFEKGRARERIVLVRAENGQMRLWDLIIEPKPQ